METKVPDRAELISMIAAAAEGLPPVFREVTAVEAYVDKLLSAARFEVIRDDDQVAGLVAYYANDLTTRRAFITLVSVAPAARKRGIAARLVSQVITRCENEGFKEVTLQVLEDNEAANALYEKHHFYRVSTQDGQHTLMRTL